MFMISSFILAQRWLKPLDNDYFDSLGRAEGGPLSFSDLGFGLRVFTGQAANPNA